MEHHSTVATFYVNISDIISNISETTNSNARFTYSVGLWLELLKGHVFFLEDALACQGLPYKVDFPGGSRVNNLPAMQDTRVQSLGWEKSPGEGNGNPLQYSCLENPMDREVWQATVHGVAKNQTRLKWLNNHHHHTKYPGLTDLNKRSSSEAWKSTVKVGGADSSKSCEEGICSRLLSLACRYIFTFPWHSPCMVPGSKFPLLIRHWSYQGLPIRVGLVI